MTTRRAKKGAANRRSRKTNTSFTVEGLHASFEKIDQRVATLLQRSASDADIAHCIRKGWAEQFHLSISPAAVKGMIVHYRTVLSKPEGRKTRKQKGGMAPISFMMGQGITDNVYGNFPVAIGTTPLVIKGLDLGRFYESDGGRVCNSTGGHPAPGIQSAGGILDSIANGYPPASVPANAFQTTVNVLQGVSPGPSSSPVTMAPTPVSYFPQPFDASSLSNVTTLRSTM